MMIGKLDLIQHGLNGSNGFLRISNRTWATRNIIHVLFENPF